MKNKKMSLHSLKVQSFVTGVAGEPIKFKAGDNSGQPLFCGPTYEYTCGRLIDCPADQSFGYSCPGYC